MSNSLAIAAVTATLRNLVGSDPDLAGTFVTTLPLDRARPENDGENRLNVFCYRTALNGALRNMGLPGRVRPGETEQHPLALSLHYALTAFGSGNDEVASNRLLGRAMRILHDHPMLSRTAVANALADSDLDDQLELVKITPEALSIDDISKLWSAFGTEYRFSAFYEASVVLIESRRPARAPLPVLRRGEDDAGVVSHPDLIPAFPAITDIRPPDDQPAALPGDLLVVSGHHLAGDAASVRFASRRLPTPVVQPVEPGGSDQQLRVRVPDQPTTLPAGHYTVAADVTSGGDQRLSNELPLPIAPELEDIAPAGPLPAGTVTLTITPRPQVRLEQRAALLFGSREVLPEPRGDQAAPLVFAIAAVAAGEYFLRLRVDGVDSLLVDRSVRPPVFSDAHKVTVT